MPRVLILTASYGSGHNAAARSLALALEDAGARVDVVDHFRELVHPAFDRASRALYAWVLRRAPQAWGLAYALGDRLRSDSPLVFGASRLGRRRLALRLAALRPDAVVTVHATPAVAMSALAAEGHRLPPHTTVVTDFVAHSQWIAPRVDRYCVAAEEVRHDFIARGIPADRIVVTGVPVRPEFERPADRAAARAAHGLPLDRPVVLAMAGARGSFGRLAAVARALTRVRHPLAGLIVAGEDERLVRRLRRLVGSAPVSVVGWVHDIPDLMAAADLLVTKAGGMTLAEAMAAGLPLVIFGSLPGQEQRNERFAARQGIALVARSGRDLTAVIEQALADRSLLKHLRERLHLLGRPDAARRIARLVLDRRPL
ncbi:MAG TPA: glycosyltransferase [Calidithermus sp.]|nr:glycosyltransferase [Calidithermus sp.]